MRKAHALFVTGTDTGVGKTVVAAGLVAAWRRRGVDAVGFKPVETGVPGFGNAATHDGAQRWPACGAVPADGISLAAASDWCASLPEVVAEAFPAPLAPAVAAEQAGVALEPAKLKSAFEALAARHDLVVVEGAGGLAVALTRDYDTADFVRELGIPLLVVCRPNLGTLNHTRLTVHYAHMKGISTLGLVVNGMPPEQDHAAYAADPALNSNPRELEAQTGLPLLATLPNNSTKVATPAEAATLIAANLDLEALQNQLKKGTS